VADASDGRDVGLALSRGSRGGGRQVVSGEDRGAARLTVLWSCGMLKRYATSAIQDQTARRRSEDPLRPMLSRIGSHGHPPRPGRRGPSRIPTVRLLTFVKAQRSTVHVGPAGCEAEARLARMRLGRWAEIWDQGQGEGKRPRPLMGLVGLRLCSTRGGLEHERRGWDLGTGSL